MIARLVVLLLLFAAPAWPDAYSTMISSHGACQHWRMNATSGTTEVDVSTNPTCSALHQNLTYSGSGYTLNQPGPVPGTGKSVLFSGGHAFNNTNYTGTGPWNTDNFVIIMIEAWVKDWNGYVLSHACSGPPCSTPDYGWAVSAAPGSAAVGSWTSGGATRYSAVGGTLSAGEWHIVHWMLDETGNPDVGVYKVWVDCELVATDTSNSTPGSFPGAANGGIDVARRFDLAGSTGSLSELVVYNGVSGDVTRTPPLSEAQMCQHLAMGSILPGRRIIDASSGRRLLYGLARLEPQSFGPAMLSWFKMKDRALE